MENSKKDIFIALIALLVMIAAVIWILQFIFRILGNGWNGLLAFLNTLTTLDTAILIALISGMITIFGLVINSGIQVYFKRLEFKHRKSAQIEESYKTLIDF